jgi:hypothetical protein
MRLLRILSTPSAALLVAICAPGAFATSLAPGQTINAIGTIAIIGTDTLVTSQGVAFVSADGAFSGTLDSAVWRNNATGDLDFVYQFINNSSSTDVIDEMSASKFGTYTTDVFYDPTENFIGFTGTIAPSQADRSSTGNAVNFGFDSPIEVEPGETSYALVIRTNATTYSPGNVSLQNNSSSPLNLGYQPAPEPAEAGILLGGLFAAGLFVARKFRVQQS